MSGVIEAVNWKESADELYERYRAERDVEARKRLGALWLVRREEGVSGAAQSAGVSRRTLTRWLGWCRRGGLQEVLSRVPGHGATGKECRLSERQRRLLLERASLGEFRTYEETRRWVEQEWGVRYRYKGMYALLARMGVRPKVCPGRRRPRRPIPTPKRRGKGGLVGELSQAGVASGRAAWHSDEMRLGLRGQTRKVLAPKGVKVVQRLQLRYEWSYLVLAVSPLTGEIRWEWIERMRKEHLLPVLERWALEAVVWDRAPSHRAKILGELIPTKRVFLPSHSPELNPAERVFEEVDRKSVV